MYVCICNAVTETDIREAYADGVTSMRQLKAELGVAACCGRCAPTARALLKRCHAETREAEAVQADMPHFTSPATG